MIFYFSATGNCKRIAESLDCEKALPMTSEVIGVTPELTPDEPLGFVFPTYFWGLPTVVAKFLSEASLPDCSGRYVFVVASYGTTTGGSTQMACRLLQERGIEVSASFAVRMPDVWTPIFDLSDTVRVAKKVEDAEAQIGLVSTKVAARAQGDFVRAKLPYPMARAYYATYGVQSRTSAFSVDPEACIGCSLCARKCPVQAIEMHEGIPTWTTKRCVMCLGCLHRCPKFAIQRGRNTHKHGQYTNPHTKV